MRKSLNHHLDKIEKQTVEEMVSEEQNLQAVDDLAFSVTSRMGRLGWQ
jgi:hypothetical protein